MKAAASGELTYVVGTIRLDGKAGRRGGRRNDVAI